MKLTKTRPRTGTGEPLLALWQGTEGEDLDAVRVFEDALVIHHNTQQKRRRYRRAEVPFSSFEGTSFYFQTLYLRTKGQTGVRGVAISDEKSARLKSSSPRWRPPTAPSATLSPRIATASSACISVTARG